MKRRCGACGKEDLPQALLSAQPHVNEGLQEKGANGSMVAEIGIHGPS